MNKPAIFVAALALLIAPVLAGCEQEPETKKEVVRPVRAIQIGETLRGSRWFPGRAKAAQEVDLAFEVPGKLVERPINVGDEVKKGDILARLDPRDYENELATARAEMERAKSFLDRIAQAIKTGAVAKQDLTDAQASYDMSAAQVKIKEKAVEDTVLRAPFDGTVSWTYVENFDNVRAKQPVVRLVDTSKIEFVVNIPEGLISAVRQVSSVRVRFDAFRGHEVPARIKEIATEASETTRTYPVNLIMDQPKEFKILPGMAGKATGEGPKEKRRTAIVVPVTAVFSPKEGDASYVWVIDEETKTVTRREVETGPLTDAGIPILSGLKVGEWIATAGVHYLKEGQKVRILRGERAAG